MQQFIATYWPAIGFILAHGTGVVWMFSGLMNRVHNLEKELAHYHTVHERLARLEATSVSVAESLRRIEAHLLKGK